MIDPITASIRVAGAGLQAQSARLRVVSENLANADSTGATPGADPYARKTVTFESEMDRAMGVIMINVKGTDVDNKPFKVEYNPSHPAADDKGYVKKPNVEVLTEMADLREANRSYQANLQTVRQAREMFMMTLDLLKG